MEINGPSGTFQIAVALILGIGAIGYGAYSYSAQTAALDSAVEVDATVTETAIEEMSARRGTEYAPKVTFRYTYEGESYVSSNVFPGKLPREFDTRDAARAELDGYGQGETVTAYVPPDAPGNAYLKHESSNKPLLVVGIGVVLALGAIRSALKR